MKKEKTSLTQKEWHIFHDAIYSRTGISLLQDDLENVFHNLPVDLQIAYRQTSIDHPDIINEAIKILDQTNFTPDDSHIKGSQSRIQETQSGGKNSINIAIDFDRDANPPMHVNIDTIVNGKAKETYNVPYNDWANKSFKVLWDDIGENIQSHMTENPDYNVFGS